MLAFSESYRHIGEVANPAPRCRRYGPWGWDSPIVRRRRVAVVDLSACSGPSTAWSRLTLRVSSTNHDQVRRQLARLLDVANLNHEEKPCDDAA